MTQEQKAKAYDEALERAKAYHRNELAGSKKEMMEYIFPELRESEDERIRKWLVELVQNTDTNHSNMKLSENCKLALAYLEKQEQKPNPTEDMPYITDEHFYEREPADSFKYKLAEYMTKCCTKKEGPYGYTYGISAESILKMAEEELLKRGVVQKPVECLKAERDGWYVCIKDFYAGGKKQCSIGDLVQAKGGMYMMGKEDISEWFRRAYYEEVRDAFGPNTDTNIPEQKPAEWSEEDEKMIDTIVSTLGQYIDYKAVSGTGSGYATPRYSKEIDWLKSLRPSWKPSEVHLSALLAIFNDPDNIGSQTCQLALTDLYEQLKKL